MKRILIVFSNLNVGNGPPIALLNLLNILPQDGYQYDLLLTSRYDEKYGHHWNRIPEHINVLPQLYQLSKYSKSLMAELRHNGLDYMAGIREKVRKRNIQEGEDRIRNWEDLKKIVPVYSGYDIAIAYIEDIALQIVADKVNAEKKIGWVHSDYRMTWDEETIRRKAEYWGVVDKIVCVSKQNGESFAQCYGDFRKKITVIYNPNDSTFIKQKADEFYPKEYTDVKDCVKLFTSGTIGYRKGTDLIIDSVRLLLDEGYDIRWYIAGMVGAGDSHNGEECVKRINNEGLKKNIVLLGHLPNPYPYYKHCDIYVHPSRWEGLSVAIQEAKIFCKPILVTNHSSVDEIIENGETGIICDINAEAIARSVKLMIDNKRLREELSTNLRHNNDFNDNYDRVYHDLFDN